MQEPQLAIIQRRFQSDIHNDTSQCVGELKSTKDHSSSRRLDVYRLSISQQVSCVSEDFPILAEHLGGVDHLEEWIERFLRTRPSTSTDIDVLGSGFADYLRDINEPLLSEIARYDWSQVLCKTEVETVNSHFPITRLNENDLVDAQLITDPTLQLFTSPYSVHQDNKVNACFLAIRFVEGETKIVEMEKKLFNILKAIVAKKPLPDILSELTDAKLTSDIVSQVFAEWVKNGTIIGFVKPEGIIR